MIESGYPDFVFATDGVLLAPAKTPPEKVKWLEAETLKVLSTPDLKDKLFQAGFLVRPKGGAAAWARVTKEMDLFKRLSIRAASRNCNAAATFGGGEAGGGGAGGWRRGRGGGRWAERAGCGKGGVGGGRPIGG